MGHFSNEIYMVQLSEYKRYEIAVMHKQGYSKVEIMRQLKIGRHAVDRWIDRVDKTGKASRKHGSGRQKKERDKENIIINRELSKNNISIRDLQAILIENNITYSLGSVYKLVCDLGFTYDVPSKEPLLTEANKKTRLDWALKHQNYDFDMVIFSDETHIEIVDYDRKRWIKTGINDIIQTVKYPYKVSIWGCIFKGGGSSICIFTEVMDSNKYIEILDSHFTWIYSELENYGSKMTFQQDNDPRHTSRTTKEYLNNNRIRVLDWPSYSPDLNPIENLWNIIKSKVFKYKYDNAIQFRKAILDVWYSIESSVIDSLIDSMPERVQKVIDNKGGHILY
jgi:transposase